MVFRKDSKVDAFQRQIGALRQQLGVAGESDPPVTPDEPPTPAHRREHAPVERQAERHQYDDAGRSSTPRERTDPAPFSFRESVEQRQQSAIVQHDEPLPPVVPSIDVDDQTSVIAANTLWRGDFETDGTMHVHGRVEGSIRARHDVFVAEEADVNASIDAGNVIVAGVIRGTVRCTARFEVLARGRVLADVHAPTLIVHDGARVRGQLRMGPLEVGKVSEAPTPTSTTAERRVAHAGS